MAAAGVLALRPDTVSSIRSIQLPAAQQVGRARITFEQAIEQARRQGQLDLAQRLKAKQAELGH